MSNIYILASERWKHVKHIKECKGKEFAWRMIWASFEQCERKEVWSKMTESERDSLLETLHDSLLIHSTLIDVFANTKFCKKVKLLRMSEIKCLAGIKTINDAYLKIDEMIYRKEYIMPNFFESDFFSNKIKTHILEFLPKSDRHKLLLIQPINIRNEMIKQKTLFDDAPKGKDHWIEFLKLTKEKGRCGQLAFFKNKNFTSNQRIDIWLCFSDNWKLKMFEKLDESSKKDLSNFTTI